MILPAPPWMIRRGLTVEEDIAYERRNYSRSALILLVGAPMRTQHCSVNPNSLILEVAVNCICRFSYCVLWRKGFKERILLLRIEKT